MNKEGERLGERDREIGGVWQNLVIPDLKTKGRETALRWRTPSLGPGCGVSEAGGATF